MGATRLFMPSKARATTRPVAGADLAREIETANSSGVAPKEIAPRHLFPAWAGQWAGARCGVACECVRLQRRTASKGPLGLYF